MAELREGERPQDHMKRPPAGFYTCASVCERLGINSYELHRHLKALKIVVGPFIRDEPLVYKVYKRQKRWLTEEEVRRVVERVFALRGRAL
jgi:hypothetical protein